MHSWMLLPALPVVVAIGLWAVLELERFVYLLIPASMVSPAVLARPAGAIVSLADLLFVVALVAWLVVNSVRGRPHVWLRRNPLLLPTVVFTGLTIGSLAWTIHVPDTVKLSVQIIEIVLLHTLLFASVASRLDTIRTGLIVFTVFALALAVVAVVVVGSGVGSGNLESLELPGGLNKNVVGSFTGAGAVLAYVFLISAGGGRARTWWGIAVLVLLTATIATFSRGSMLGAGISIVVASLLLRRSRFATCALVAALAVGYLAVIGTDSRVGSGQLKAGSYSSGTVRKYSFEDGVRKIEHRPVLGSGAGTYTVTIAQLGVGLSDPNNTFLLTWAELGIFGMASWLFLLWRYAGAMARARRLAAPESALAVGAGCVALSLLLHFQVDVTWTRGTASLAFAMMGVMIAVQRLALRPDTTTAPTVGAASVPRRARATAGVT